MAFPVLFFFLALPSFAQLPRIVFSGGADYSGGVFKGTAAFRFPMQPIPLMVNAPFSGQERMEASQTLTDGTHVNRPAHDGQKVWRDSQGRIRMEATFVSGPTTDKNLPTLVELEDPVAGYIYLMDDVNQVAHRVKATVVKQQDLEKLLTRVVPAGAKGGPQPQSSQQDLGTETMDGVVVHGTRTTTVFPTGSRNNDAPYTATRDLWYSSDLNMVIRTISSGPGSGSTDGIANLSRNEPDPSLFVVPAGYSVVDENGPFEIAWGK